MRLVLLACLALFLSTSAEVAKARSADERAAMAADEAFYHASLTAKGQAWQDFADEHATLPAGSGKAAIGAFYDKVYARPGFALNWHPDSAKVMGDIAITTGRYDSHIQDDTGHDKPGHGRYVTVWQRQKEGGWRFVWDGGTEDH
jgi:ketosteroid isomerase-like protein